MDIDMEFNHKKPLIRWMLYAFYISLALTIILFIVAPALSYLVMNGMSQNSMATVNGYFAAISKDFNIVFHQYGKWFSQIWHGKLASALGPWIMLLPFITIPVGLLIGYLTCPYRERIRS